MLLTGPFTHLSDSRQSPLCEHLLGGIDGSIPQSSVGIVFLHNRYPHPSMVRFKGLVALVRQLLEEEEI